MFKPVSYCGFSRFRHEVKRCPVRSIRNCHYTLRNNPEESVFMYTLLIVHSTVFLFHFSVNKFGLNSVMSVDYFSMFRVSKVAITT